MSTMLIQLYHKLPPSMRMVAASIEGYKLRRRRYGAGFEQCVAMIRARQSWTRSDWQVYQQTRLASMLDWAAQHVQHYRQHFDHAGMHKDWHILSNWPVLEKNILREQPLDFVADECNIRTLIRVYTSGTTGTPLQILRSRRTEQTWYAMFEVRVRNAYGVHWRDRWAILGGRLVAPVTQATPPFWIMNHGMNQLYLSSYHLNHRFAQAYLQALSVYQPAYFLGYTSALYTLAQFILETGCSTIRPKVVITNAEPVYDHQREVITEAFGCPIVETYGMTEMGTAGVRCKYGYYHLWPDLGYVELLSDAGKPVQSGEIGHVVCTTLLNRDQPLIRYRTGDLAIGMPETFVCPCGNTMPVLAQLEGRCDDVIVTRDGRTVGRLDPVFKMGLNIREAQIVQKSVEHVVIRFVPDVGYSDTDGQHLRQSLQARIGACHIALEPVEHIERTRSGKFQAVVSEVGRGSS